MADRTAMPGTRRRARAQAAVAVYGRLVAARMRADAQYRVSFALLVAGQAVVAVADLAAILVLFTTVPALAGWSRDEVVFLYGLSGLSFALADLGASQVELASRHIRAGTFDLFLVRPVGVLLQLSGCEFSIRRAGRLLQPAVALVVVLPRLPVRWGLAEAALVPVTVLSGAVIFGAVWVVTATVSFWTIDSQEAGNAFTYGGSLLTQYPLDVYGEWIRRFFTGIVPLAFVSYLPAAWLLDRPPATGRPAWLAVAPVVVAAVSVAVARLLWRHALRHYRSTGS